MGAEQSGVEWNGVEQNRLEWNGMEIVHTSPYTYTQVYINNMSIYNIKCNYYCGSWLKIFKSYKSKALVFKLLLNSEDLCERLMTQKIDSNPCSLKVLSRKQDSAGPACYNL